MPFFLLYCLITGKHLSSLKQRFGILPTSFKWKHQHRIWLHAASVGEVKAAKALISELERQNIKADFIITTVTEQGQYTAVKELGANVLALYAPIDLPFIVNRFIKRLTPTIYICLETELWPNIIRILYSNNVKTLLLNGRLSDNSFKSYKKIKGFIGQVIGLFSAISTIQNIDKDRYLALGAPPEKTTVNGNAKYDLGRCLDNPAELKKGSVADTAQQLKNLLSIHKRHTILIAGSTHSGEEEQLLDVFLTLQQSIPNFLLIIAPRHLQRLPKIKKMLTKRNIPYQDYSEAIASGRKQRCLLVNSMGELSKLYSIANFVFCGGSLVERGGHNIMEAAIWGKPPFYGPSMKDFADACTLLEAAGASFPITSSRELTSKIDYFHKHPDDYTLAGKQARDTAVAQQGSATKQVDIIKEALAA